LNSTDQAVSREKKMTQEQVMIPNEFIMRPQWVDWKSEKRNGKFTKVPYQTNGHNAKSNEASTWNDFDSVFDAYREGKFDGIGYVLSSNDPFVAFDLDNCRDPNTGEIAAWAQEIVHSLNSYTEITPSDEGLRVIVEAKLPPHGRKKGNVEIYDDKRFITVTGRHVAGTPATIENRERETLVLHTKIFGDNTIPKNGATFQPKSLNFSDAEIIKKAQKAKNGAKFSKLWQGDWSDYSSQSEADQALCSMLAFWVPEPARIDSLFRLSGLYREKWDERHYSNGTTYGQQTIENAINGVKETYGMQQKKNSNLVIMDTENEFRFTDLGNAKRLVRKFGKDMRYCYKWRTWLVWAGKRWRRDDSGRVMQMAKDTITGLYQEASGVTDKSNRKDLVSWAVKSESNQRLEAMIKLTRSEPGIPIDPSELDRNEMQLNVLNGTLDLKTGEFL